MEFRLLLLAGITNSGIVNSLAVSTGLMMWSPLTPDQEKLLYILVGSTPLGAATSTAIIKTLNSENLRPSYRKV